LGIALIFAVIRPFERQVDEEDVAELWTDSVKRLGILPLYPPEEDFYVGDLWAVIASSTAGPILGEGLRLGHVNLRQHASQPEANGETEREPVFAETMEVQKEGYRRQSPLQVDERDPKAAKISLTLVGFPGVNIRHAIGARGAVNGPIAALAGRRDEVEVEEIRIPVAETYGVPAIAAFTELTKYCANSETYLQCTDRYARNALSFALTDRVLQTANGAYTMRLDLRLINRVFLTREIYQKRYRAGARGASIGTSNPIQRDAVASDKGNGRTSLAPEASGSITWTDTSTEEFNQVFQRPVAFGYRAISISLSPSIPSEDRP
jgi:hypothetical protein